MRDGLWNVFARMMRRVWGRAAGGAPEPNRGDDGTRRTASRAQFWAEFREGQREAEARTKEP